MRVLLACLILACATAAAAQDLTRDLYLQQELQAQQRMIEQRMVAQSNQLMALEAQQRADQALLDLRLQALRQALPALPQLPYPQNAPPARIDTSKLPSIPDDALSESNARVRSAAEGR
jgi:hypothetical protein